MTGSEVLSLKKVSVSLADQDRRFTLDIPELDLVAGDAIGLTGPSGTGKTLLLETLGLLRRPGSAHRFEIATDDERVDLTGIWSKTSISPAEIRGSRFGFVPQSGGLLPFLNVAANVALSQKVAGREDPDLCAKLLDRLDIGEIATLFPAALSIGQRQRVAICRALAHRPSFVIADEPTAALDPDAASTAMGLLIDTAALEGAAVMISSHDLNLLDQFNLRRVSLSLLDNVKPGQVTSQLRGSVGAGQVEATV